tara:strand:- start:65408 stop:65599 length:192 start_codon:yes stop_codon:yes gene_type:complete
MPVHAMQRHGLVGDYWLGITKIKKPGLYGRAFLVSHNQPSFQLTKPSYDNGLRAKKDHPKVVF